MYKISRDDSYKLRNWKASPRAIYQVDPESLRVWAAVMKCYKQGN